MSDVRSVISRWISGMVVALALIYAAPHVWWMFGISTGFPGDTDDLDAAFERTWFAVYNLTTTVMVLTGAAMVTAIESRRLREMPRRVLWNLVLIGAVLLLLRGSLGLLTSIPYAWSDESDLRPAALFWECWFILTGILYAVAASRHR